MKQKFLYLFLFIFSFFLASPALAGDPKLTIQDSAYAAKFVSQSVPDPITIEAGGTKEVIFKFKNIGSATWSEKGNNYLSAYTVEPKYHASEFRGSNWIGKSQTAKIKGTVKPGQVGELTIDFKAPDKIGEYVERFYLSSENKSWVEGSYFFVKIKVVEPRKKVIQAPVPKVEESNETVPSVPQVSVSSFKAKFLGMSKPQVTLAPGERTSIMFMYQNVGRKSWNSFSFKGNEQVALAGTQISFADDNWKSSTIVREGTVNIAADGVLQKNFTLKAPTQEGTYKAQFYLEVDGEKVEGSEAFVDVTVTANTPGHVMNEIPLAPLPVTPSPRLAEEPKIRVGLLKVEKDIIFSSTMDEYDVFSGETLLKRLPVNAKATLSYAKGVYTCICDDELFTSSEYFRFAPVNNPHSVFTLDHFERTVPWQKGVNFNTYHGVFEFRFPQKGDLPYAINELYFEDYIAGIREVSNGTPMEYMKSQAVLERTYAYYIKEHTSKHDERNFDVVASTGDQLYLGETSERLMPRFVEAVNSTRGQMVVYDVDKNPDTMKEIVITPYFGNSNGMTKSFKQVWGGKDDKPWLMPVAAIYDKRDKKKMYGHGVGMSQRDAMIKANEEKLDFIALIQYYYTGVDVETIY